MFSKIKDYYRKIHWNQLRDIRTFGLFVFLIIVLLTTWSGVKAIQTNYELQKQISELQQENQVQQLKNTNLQLQNEYFNTNQYLELAARQNFGLALPGETELVVSRKTALAHITQLPIVRSPSNKQANQQPSWQRNFQAWVNFFLHRQQSLN